MAKKELAVIDKFEIVSPVDGMDEELREEFMDEMDYGGMERVLSEGPSEEGTVIREAEKNG